MRNRITSGARGALDVIRDASNPTERSKVCSLERAAKKVRPETTSIDACNGDNEDKCAAGSAVHCVGDVFFLLEVTTRRRGIRSRSA